MVDEPESVHEKERIERLRQAMYSRSRSEKLHARERRELDEEKSVVGDNWNRPEPHMEALLVAPTGIGFGKMLLYWILGGAIIFFIGASAFFIYYFTIGGGSSPASPQNISISVAGPPQVAGGEVTELQIAITNRNRVPLESAELVIHYPQGTRTPAQGVVISKQLESCSGAQVGAGGGLSFTEQRICLGNIEPGGLRQGTVAAVFAGIEGARANVKVELEYHVSGSNSVYVASSGYALNFSSSPLSISVDGANEAISGQPVQLTITVASNANRPMKDTVLSASYPFGFKESSATPEQTAPGFWALGDMSPGQKKTIVVNGVLTGESGDERVFRFAAGTRTDAAKNVLDTALSKITFHTSISQAFLRLALSINESTAKTVTVSPGEKVTVAVSYQNNLPNPIENAVIVAKLSGMQFDGSDVRSSDGFYRSSDGAMFWDKSTTDGRFANLAPGEKGFVSFTFTMPANADLQGEVNPHLDISVNAAGSRVAETGVPQALQSTARATIALATDLELIAEGLYYTNPFGSTGPIPPKADTETTYAIVFTVTNTTNKITGATLTADLPTYVRWVGIYSPASEKITFNQRDSTVTWKLDDIEPGVGLNGTQPRQAAIAIGFTPSTSQIGTQPVLLRHIVLKGTDASSTQPVIRNIEDVSSNLSRVSKSSSDIIATGDPGFSSSNATVVK